MKWFSALAHIAAIISLIAFLISPTRDLSFGVAAIIWILFAIYYQLLGERQ